MVSRRDFLSTVAVGMTGMAAAPLLRADTSVTAAVPALTQKAETATGRYRPPYRLGQGGGPVAHSAGIAISDDEARAVMENAWNSGMRFYDTSPWYGLGLGERRFGQLLHQKPRQDYVLSTKVGRILTASANPKKTGWANPSPFDYRYDYSAAATRRSIEDSLQRLGIESLDIVLIHDLSPDNSDMKDNWQEYFDQAVKGAMPELTRMREEGIIKAWGMGVNTLPPILKAIEQADPDIFLAACQYSLIEHQESLDKLFPACDERGISIIVGSPLNNGFLVGRDRFNYSGTIPVGFKEKRTQMERIATAHGIDLRTAALQFCAAPATVSCVIPGARREHQPAENVASMRVNIPADFWAELKQEKLISEQAPLPVNT